MRIFFNVGFFTFVHVASTYIHLYMYNTYMYVSSHLYVQIEGSDYFVNFANCFLFSNNANINRVLKRKILLIWHVFAILRKRFSEKEALPQKKRLCHKK